MMHSLFCATLAILLTPSLGQQGAPAPPVTLQAQLQAKFEELAKQSKDTGSAANGGDLNYFSKGQMVKPFEDAVEQLADMVVDGLIEKAVAEVDSERRISLIQDVQRQLAGRVRIDQRAGGGVRLPARPRVRGGSRRPAYDLPVVPRRDGPASRV